MARPDFKPAFGPHPVPQLLDDLGEFAADVKGYFSGRFKLAPGGAEGWLGGPERAGEFAVFGHDADGSCYALWLYDGRGPAEAPVVYLNAAHSGSTVIAQDLPEFLSLLALDVTDLGMYYDEANRPRKHSPGHAAFVTWLAECFGIQPAAHAERLVKRAAAAHPTLASRYGKRGA
ncbi:MAG: hypothetical protein VKQ33_13910 [Candidatus Sericytochromatia bacterium]|nr:hypothetical protein [Candidatus Sericytochromatia bacterium]